MDIHVRIRTVEDCGSGEVDSESEINLSAENETTIGELKERLSQVLHLSSQDRLTTVEKIQLAMGSNDCFDVDDEDEIGDVISDDAVFVAVVTHSEQPIEEKAETESSAALEAIVSEDLETSKGIISDPQIEQILSNPPVWFSPTRTVRFVCPSLFGDRKEDDIKETARAELGLNSPEKESEKEIDLIVCNDLEKAIESARPGDVVLIRPGCYETSSPLCVPCSGVILIGLSRNGGGEPSTTPNVCIRGRSNPLISCDVLSMWMKGISFEQTTSSEPPQGDIDAEDFEVEFCDSTVPETMEVGADRELHLRSCCTVFSGSPLIENCVFTSEDGRAMTVLQSSSIANPHAIDSGDRILIISSPTVRNSTFYDAGRSGVTIIGLSENWKFRSADWIIERAREQIQLVVEMTPSGAKSSSHDSEESDDDDDDIFPVGGIFEECEFRGNHFAGIEVLSVLGVQTDFPGWVIQPAESSTAPVLFPIFRSSRIHSGKGKGALLYGVNVKPLFEHVCVENNFGSGITGSFGANVYCRHCLIKGNGQFGSGICCFGGSQGEIVSCNISESGLSGIQLSGHHTALLIESNDIHDNGEAGIDLFDHAAGRIVDNSITANHGAGISIDSKAHPHVLSNRIHDGFAEGIVCLDRAKGKISENDICRNEFVSIAIRTRANPTICHNSIHHSKSGGIFVHEDGLGMIEKNSIFANALTGIEIMTRGRPSVICNRIYENTHFGIWISSGGSGFVEQNDIFENGKGGIFLQAVSVDSMIGNSVHDHGEGKDVTIVPREPPPTAISSLLNLS